MIVLKIYPILTIISNQTNNHSNLLYHMSGNYYMNAAEMLLLL
jgi:hypothetical protein